MGFGGGGDGDGGDGGRKHVILPKYRVLIAYQPF